jgi:hypothetical protein
VDVDGLILTRERKVFLLQVRRNHAGNHAAGDTDDRTVHAGAVVVHQGHIAVRGAQQAHDYGGLEDQVRFDRNDLEMRCAGNRLVRQSDSR